MQAAKERHRSEVRWGLLALVIDSFAFIPLVLLGSSKKGLARSEVAQQQARVQEHGYRKRRKRACGLDSRSSLAKWSPSEGGLVGGRGAINRELALRA